MIAIKYTLFAIISIFLNLFFQYISFKLYTGFGSFYIALLTGTLIGLISKYTLDKKYIFYHMTIDNKGGIKQFILYAFTGSLITAVFWITEIAFDRMFENEQSKYIGAFIGLTIGYITKYLLDKKYVFKQY